MNPRRILAVVKARNREFLRDKAGLGWNILMPVVMVFGFAFIFSTPDEHLFKVGVLGAEAPVADEAWRDLPHVNFGGQGDVEAAIEKVRHHRLDLLVDVRDDTRRYWVNELSARGVLAERLLQHADGKLSPDWKRQPVSGTPVRYVDWVLPGILAINVMFSSLWGVGWVIVRYRKNGVLRRLRATPLTASEFLVAQIASRLLVVLSVSILVFMGTNLLLEFQMHGSYLALASVLFAGAIAMISVGLAIAARIRNEELADGLLNLISWPMMILSGVWFSLEGTNVWAQRMAELLPLTHMIDAARRIMLDGAGLADVLFEIGLLLVIGVVLLTVSARAFRWQ